MSNLDKLKPSLTSWIKQYPGHPAIPSITEGILEISKGYNTRPEHISLILPFSGQYQKASETIRDGFLAAWYESDEYKPIINIYDADALSIESTVILATQNGADFIVGPLEKEAVAILEKLKEPTVKILALNRSDKKAPDNPFAITAFRLPEFMQFALAPEDEARQTAQRAFFDGHLKALVLTPQNEWGNRLFNAFQEEWTLLGGEILEYVNYVQKTKDYISPVKELLNLDSSEFRARILKEKLTTIFSH
jgi:hypothetical protein